MSGNGGTAEKICLLETHADGHVLVAVPRRAADLQLSGDHDSYVPVSMASGSQGAAKRPYADKVAPREGVAGGTGAIRPSRGAEDTYAQARTLFRAMVHMPHYAEEVRTSMLRRWGGGPFSIALASAGI